MCGGLCALTLVDGEEILLRRLPIQLGGGIASGSVVDVDKVMGTVNGTGALGVFAVLHGESVCTQQLFVSEHSLVLVHLTHGHLKMTFII